MNDWTAVWLLLAILAILGAITLIASKQWLPARVATPLYFLSGCGIVLMMYACDIPPGWFEGSWEGFGLALSLLAWAFVLSTRAERAFGRPLLLGMSGTLIVLNVAAHL